MGHGPELSPDLRLCRGRVSDSTPMPKYSTDIYLQQLHASKHSANGNASDTHTHQRQSTPPTFTFSTCMPRRACMKHASGMPTHTSAPKEFHDISVYRLPGHATVKLAPNRSPKKDRQIHQENHQILDRSWDPFSPVFATDMEHKEGSPQTTC